MVRTRFVYLYKGASAFCYILFDYTVRRTNVYMIIKWLPRVTEGKCFIDIHLKAYYNVTSQSERSLLNKERFQSVAGTGVTLVFSYRYLKLSPLQIQIQEVFRRKLILKLSFNNF